MSRQINAPGIEIHEIDRSQYDVIRNSSTNGTGVLVLGFADIGDDYSVKWINSMNTFQNEYGTPTTEAEKYFYNAAYEVINGGGILYTAKLPYDNDSFKKFSYTSYDILSDLIVLSSTLDIIDGAVYSTNISSTLYRFLLTPDITLDSMYSLLNETQESELDTSIPIEENPDDSTIIVETTGNEKNVVELLNSVGIYLKTIRGLLEYLVDKMNFSYETKLMIKDVFYTNGNVKNRTGEAIKRLVEDFDDGISYLLNEMRIDTDVVKKYYQRFVEMVDNINKYISRRTDYVTFDDIILEYGKTIDLVSYNEYFIELQDTINNLTASDVSISQTDVDFLKGIINSFENTDLMKNTEYTDIRTADRTLTSMIKINSSSDSSTGYLSYENFDRFSTGDLRVPQNKIFIVDKTRGKYDSDDLDNEYIGILPVITTAANAMYFQGIINDNDLLDKYNVIDSIRNVNEDVSHTKTYHRSGINGSSSTYEYIGLTQNLGSESDMTIDDFTLSKQVVKGFPTIKYINDTLDRKYMKQIGVVVVKMYKDKAHDNRTGFIVLESFVGSLDRYDVDILTGKSTFIDNVVNSNSDYISLFSNADISRQTDDFQKPINQASLYLINNQECTSLGFYSPDTKKMIRIQTSIFDSMQTIFSNGQDRNTLDIDIIVDGGVSNIAQFIADVWTTDSDGNYVNDVNQRCGYFDIDLDNAYQFSLDSINSTKIWRNVLLKFDQFVKDTRKDCMFIADGLRPLCLQGKQKIVRTTSPSNTVIDNIIPKLKYISGFLNSSYSAGYLNWFYSREHYSGEYMWMPPSVKALGVYMYTDTYSNYWDAPAGMNRGKISDTVDTAFNPSNDEAGYIYINSWNYAVNYPIDGIILEGQRTFQTNKTALDRVNVRRVMLGLEKVARNNARYFNYEGNTAYLRERLVDRISEYFQNVKNKSGISDYVIICDDRNNTTQTIENNELHVTIAVKPVKSVEFIIMNFICTNQSEDVTEIAESYV